MAVIAVLLPSTVFETWSVPRFLDNQRSLLLLLGVAALMLGITIGSARTIPGREQTVKLSRLQLQYLLRAFKVLFVLAILGYVFWAASAVAQGVGFADLAQVVGREPSAIGRLKLNSRPIAGLTTLTQFAPVAVALGAILHRLSLMGRAYWILILAAAFRTLFYAERLALIEVLIPLVLVALITGQNYGRRGALIKLAPLAMAPFVWVVFALSEYTRSWVVYESTTSVPFAQWATERLIGYYITAYNNSALFSQALEGWSAAPFYTAKAVWNAPILETVLVRPDIRGIPAEAWWSATLERFANPEFTNSGSFLVVQGELGTPAMLVFWGVAGLILGSVFAAARRGSLPALLAYLVMFVGMLELPRFIYWTDGRAVPIMLAVVVIAFTFPSHGSVKLDARASNGARNRAGALMHGRNVS